MKKPHEFPPEVVVFVLDFLHDGVPVYQAVLGAENLPDNIKGTVVGVYSLDHEATFVVEKKLES
jgi:hypothetical protein